MPFTLTFPEVGFNYFKHCALAGAVKTHKSHHLTSAYAEAYVVQGGELGVHELMLQYFYGVFLYAVYLFLADVEDHGNAVNINNSIFSHEKLLICEE